MKQECSISERGHKKSEKIAVRAKRGQGVRKDATGTEVDSNFANVPISVDAKYKIKEVCVLRDRSTPETSSRTTKMVF